ncbi:MAG TPA: LacI family DNA-binding transcriptional regulator [Devosia sp.]|nr:LacI family DNA-binding transcriptional regulator [Devosia sp.]
MAREAGVSISTVSSVVNGNKPVSEALAARVREAIEKLEFHPNHMAQSLHARRTRTLAYLTPDVTNVSILRTFKAVEAAARARGYAVFLLSTDGSVETTREAIDRVIGLRMDGAFLSLSWVMTRPEIRLDRLTERGIAMVGLAGSYDIPGIDCFLHDEEGGGRQIGSYLHRLGHRGVVCVGPTNSRAAETRWSGLRASYAEAGAGSDGDIETIVTTGYTAGAAYDAVQAMLGAGRGSFTAMVTFNDAVATGALAALSDNGLSVPDDVSLVSFGSGHRDFARPQITSVTFDEERIAALAANRLVDRIEGANSEAPGNEYLPLTLAVRASSRRLL